MASTTTKCRSVLSRTLVLVLSPLSDICQSSTGSHRLLTSTKIESVFQDFQKCNKHSISVALRDAVDDINLVGWLAPHTLLIHGSSEDMDTIQQAWAGRMLKPPQNYYIKHFCEIPSLDIKQIPQSQFVSICDTLLQIVSSLNESQIRATLGCIMTRLSSNFDSIIMPPISAVKRSLDLLVKETELDLIEGSYCIRASARTPRSATRHRSCLQKDPSVLSFNDGLHNVQQTAKHSNTDSRQFKHETTKSVFQAREKVHEHILCAQAPNDCREYKAKAAVGLAKYANKKHAKKKSKNKRYKIKTKMSKASSKTLNELQVSTRRNNSYSKLTNSDTIESETVQCRNGLFDKRSTIFGKLSRLFRKSSCEEQSSDGERGECEGWFDNDHKRHLVQNKGRNYRESKICKKELRKQDSERKEKYCKNTSAKFTRRHERGGHSQSAPSEASSANPHLKVGKQTRPSFKLPNGTQHTSSKPTKNRTSPSKERYVYTTSDFSSSESSYAQPPSISDSYSSETCVDLPEQPFRQYSFVETVKKFGVKDGEHRNVNSCSTQAICGDLEGSSRSLTSSEDRTQGYSSSDTEELKENTASLGNSATPSQNMLQLIGVL